MSDGTNVYNRLIGYVLWINRKDTQIPERVYALRGSLLGPKQYKVTLRNVKLYCEQLRQEDPTIESIMIDRLSRCGELKWDEHDSTEDRKTD